MNEVETFIVEKFESPLQYVNYGGFAFSSKVDTTSDKMQQILDVYKYLNFQNPTVLEIAFDVIRALPSKANIIISYTGDNELLIYRKENGEYRNLIIDDDGDVLYLCIPKDRRMTFNEFYSFMKVNADELASKL